MSTGTYKQARDPCDLDWPHGASRHLVEPLWHLDVIILGGVCMGSGITSEVCSAGSAAASQSSILTPWVCAVHTAVRHESMADQTFKMQGPPR